MTQPTGSTSLNSSWIAKGLKAGIYVTESGAFVFDDSASSVAASPDLSWTTNAANTGLSTPYSDLIIDLAGGGSTNIGYLHATSGMSAAFGDNMTFVFDCSPPVVGAGSYDNSHTEFLSWGTSGSGSLGIFGTPQSTDTEYKVELFVQGPIAGPVRSANIVFNTTAHRRLAFRYRRGYPVDIFVNGVIQTASGRTDDYSGSTPLPSIEPKKLLGWRPYTITPTASHLHIFNTALSDADIASLASDPWQVYGAGGGNAAPTFIGPNIGAQSGTVGTALSANDVHAKFSDTDALTFSAVGSWPPGVTVSSAGVISGTPTTAGTYSGLAVRATDTAAQTVDSDTFTFTISAAATNLVTAANSQQVNTTSSAAILQTGNGTITLPALKDWGTGNLKANETGVTIIINNASTGVLVSLLTAQTTNASGVLPTLTGLVSGTSYRITTILADGSEGTWKYTAA